MIDWYVEISDNSPHVFKSDKYLKQVIETSTPVMNYFCEKLSIIDNWKIEDANKIFISIIEEMPIMRPRVYNNEFEIVYNRWVTIRLTETTKQIYRNIKIENLLN